MGQVKGTGLANRCPEVIGEDTISPSTGQRLVDMCIEPKAWAVEEEVGKGGKTEKKFVNSKVMTRQTYTLDGIEGSLVVGNEITFKEEEGIDYAPTTVQLPGGERVPFPLHRQGPCCQRKWKRLQTRFSNGRRF